MKQVVLIRHAKSVPYGYDDDFNRPLSDRGENDANILSRQLFVQKVFPDKIISSPALRAKTTAGIYAENLNYPERNIQLDQIFYNQITTGDFIEMLHQLPDEINAVFIFGHNPTIYFLVNNLLPFFNGNIPTCSTVGISFNIKSWENLEARQGELAFHIIPRMFK